jgi:excisionase family DNA binding protein
VRPCITPCAGAPWGRRHLFTSLTATALKQANGESCPNLIEIPIRAPSWLRPVKRMTIERKPKKTRVASSEAAGSGHEVDVSPILLTPKQAAQYLSVSVSWLAKRRADGDGPPYIKMGRVVRYERSALEQYKKSRQRR